MPLTVAAIAAAAAMAAKTTDADGWLDVLDGTLLPVDRRVADRRQLTLHYLLHISANTSRKTC
jgi:hypothetical protein